MKTGYRILAAALGCSPAAAHADVVVTFWANDFMITIPGQLDSSSGTGSFPGHAFITIEGTVKQDGVDVPISEDYGFFPETHQDLRALWERVPSKVEQGDGVYISRQSNQPFVSITISDAQYRAVKSKIETWRKPSKGYIVWGQNCKDFAADMASTVGLKQPAGTFFQPLPYMRALMQANPERVRTSAQPDKALAPKDLERVLQLFDYQSVRTETERTDAATSLEISTELREYGAILDVRQAANTGWQDAQLAEQSRVLAERRTGNNALSVGAVANAQTALARQRAAEDSLRSAIGAIGAGVGSAGPTGRGAGVGSAPGTGLGSDSGTAADNGTKSGSSCGLLCLETSVPFRMVSGPTVAPGKASAVNVVNAVPQAPGPRDLAIGANEKVGLAASLDSNDFISRRGLVLWTGRRQLGGFVKLDLVMRSDTAADYVVETGTGVQMSWNSTDELPRNIMRLAAGKPIKTGIRIELPATASDVKESAGRWVRFTRNGVVVSSIYLLTDLYDQNKLTFEEQSPWLASGLGQGWNDDPYQLCSRLGIGAFQLVAFQGWTVGAGYNPLPRDCTASLVAPAWHDEGWSRCGVTTINLNQCYSFSVQGHRPNTGGGPDSLVMSVGRISASYQLDPGQPRWLKSAEQID